MAALGCKGESNGTYFFADYNDKTACDRLTAEAGRQADVNPSPPAYGFSLKFLTNDEVSAALQVAAKRKA